MSLRWAIGLAIALWLLSSEGRAETIHTDMAISPAQGITLVRSVLRTGEMGDDPTQHDRTMRMSMWANMVMHGVGPRWTVGARLPYRRMEMESGMHPDRERTGWGDFALVGKWRFAQWDGMARTQRVSAAFALEFPSGSTAFKGETINPQLGLVYTAAGLVGGLVMEASASLAHKIKPSNGDRDAGDATNLDLAVSGQILPWRTADSFLQLVLELNAEWEERDRIAGVDAADSGGRVWNFSPGLIWVSRRVIVEAGVQFPLAADRYGDQLQPKWTATAGVRFQL